MNSEFNWDGLAEEFKQIKQAGERLWADWYAYEGCEDYGIWLLRPQGPDTDEVRAVFSLNAARAIAKLCLAPIPTPQPLQHYPHWTEYCEVEEEMSRRVGKPIDLSGAVPHGLGNVDRDAVDPCTRSWLELLRRESTAFQIDRRGTGVVRGMHSHNSGGKIRDVCAASAVYCFRLAREEIRANLVGQANLDERQVSIGTNELEVLGKGNLKIADQNDTDDLVEDQTSRILEAERRLQEALEAGRIDADNAGTSSPSTPVVGKDFPKHMFHATKPSQFVENAQQQAALGSEWSDTFICKLYPRVRAHWTHKERTVKDVKEDAALGGGWGDPAAFAPFRRSRINRIETEVPFKKVNDWLRLDLSSNSRNKVKARLLTAHAAFWTAPDAEAADRNAMKQAFEGVASVLFESGVLTEQLLRNEIPTLVWDSAIEAGWYRFASETQTNMFPERFGHYFVWCDETNDWHGLFRAVTGNWLAKLLDTPTHGLTESNWSPKSFARV